MADRDDAMTQKIVRHTELEVYKKAFNCATEIFELSKKFPREEMYSLTDQIRRSSRSVCANLAEAWRKRRYETAFISKLTECEGEAAETQTWIEFAVAVGYLDKVVARKLYEQYDEILITFASMINHSESWILTKRKP
ncbi:MAG TPA: four helix bundle protein [Thermoflexales bacterium]|nr:four helix bundle protein [Thermoflexales bacterium]HQW34653.1 four helix bundle protein [Thermoflexales bacterium]HQZ99367.1 four helix bundle protein [Thermoflexales bacterium]